MEHKNDVRGTRTRIFIVLSAIFQSFDPKLEYVKSKHFLLFLNNTARNNG